jgi:hypothetical protein
MTIALPETIGSLEHTPLAHLLVTALDRRATGTLVLEEPSGSRHGLYFEAGLPRKVKTAEPVVHLGELLLQGGAISRPTYEATLERARITRRLHGQVLLAERLIEPYTLRSALSEQLCRQVTWLFERPSATQFGFFDRENLLKDWGAPESVRVNTMALIWRGVGEHLSADQVFDIVSALGNARIALREDAPIDDFHFRGRARIIVDVLRGGAHHVESLMRSGLAAPEEISRVLCALLITRSLALGVPSLPPAGTDTSEEPSNARRAAPWTFISPLAGSTVAGTAVRMTPVPPSDEAASPSQWPSPSAAPPSVPNTWRELDAYWLAAEAVTPKTSMQTPFPETKSSPSVASTPPAPLLADVDVGFPDVEASTYAASADTPTDFVEFIEEQVGSDEDRWSDEFNLEPPSTPAPDEARALPVPSEPAPHAVARPDEPVFGAESLTFDGSLDVAPPTISQPVPENEPDLFEHPLSFHDEQDETAPNTRFEPFTLELQTPTDTETTVPGMHDVGSLEGEADLDVPKSAETYAEDAERLLKRGDIPGAAREIAAALELEPEHGDYVALSAWIRVQAPTPDVPSILRDVLRSVKLARDSSRAGWHRGLTLKRLDKHAAALREFRAIVDRDPLHVDAAREVRVYEMRLKRSPKGQPSLAPPMAGPPRAGLLRRFLPRGS